MSSSEQHVRLLSEHVINKIAAGEVVERPASVLKELAENALDAGATQLDVDVVAGGRKLVAVTDNGSGMGRDDALLALERHATSKIRDVDDIEKINSLGFRGEALAAIASVSRFRLETCTHTESTGTEITISGGKIQDVRDAGCPAGTRFEVRDLFFNVPARRKFLRTHQTELAHLRSGFIVLALAHPEVGMSFTVDGRETYRLPGGAGLDERICELFGNDRISTLRPVDGSGPGVAVHGYVSVPTINRQDRNEQYVFINGRATSAAVIGYGIREGFHTLVPSGRYPSVFLFIDIDPLLVDVNVHPTKREVRFRRPSDVRDVVIRGIRDALAPTGGSRPPALPDMSTDLPPPELPRASEARQLDIEDLPPLRAFKYPRRLADDSFPDELFAVKTSPAATVSAPTAGGDAPDLGASSESPAAAAPGAAGTSPWGWCRVLGQIGGLYVVLETEDGMVMMDPHAAHERVLFEQFLGDVTDASVESQTLLIPMTVELEARDAMLVRRNEELFKQMGFGISEFGGDSFVVDALPTCFSGAGPEKLLIEMAHGLERAGGRGGTGRWREEAIAQAACKAAVKARDSLTVQEIERLVVDLSRAGMPYTCPHGRPTLVFTSFHEMNRKFGRE